MKNYLFIRLLAFKTTRIDQQGFTLIELLVVVIIVGILAAVATPNLLTNVGKSRETEAKSYLGTMSRSQQAYHFEKQTFADTIAKLNSNVSFNTTYFSFPDPVVATDILVQHQAIPTGANNQYTVRNYASGVYFDPSTSNFDMIICQGNGINQTVNAPNSSSGSCTNGGRKIK